MTEPPLTLTDLDIQILNQIYPSGKVTIAGVDPRVSVSRMARLFRTSRARVAARLRAWERSGMLVGYDVWPNPGLLGLAGASVNLRVSNPLAKAELLRRLALVDGALQTLDSLGEWISFQLLGPDPETLQRRIRLLGHLEGVAEVGEVVHWPPISRHPPLTPLDLRIVRALREAPRSSLSEVARRARVSPRTMTDRYRRLLEEKAVWFVPIYDFTRLATPVVSLGLTLADPQARGEVLRKLRSRLPPFLEFAWISELPTGTETALMLIVLPASAALLESIQTTARGVEGVVDSEATVMVRISPFRETLDAMLAQASVPARASSSSGPDSEPLRELAPRRSAPVGRVS